MSGYTFREGSAVRIDLVLFGKKKGWLAQPGLDSVDWPLNSKPTNSPAAMRSSPLGVFFSVFGPWWWHAHHYLPHSLSVVLYNWKALEKAIKAQHNIRPSIFKLDDDNFVFYIAFNSISVTFRQWKDDNVCAMKCHMVINLITPPVI